MIFFEKSEFLGGDLLDIIHFDFEQNSVENWWNNPVKSSVCILEFQSDAVNLFGVVDKTINYIPQEHEMEDIHYDIFWKSEHTIVCGSFNQAISYLENYDGAYKESVGNLLRDINSNGLTFNH